MDSSDEYASEVESEDFETFEEDNEVEYSGDFEEESPTNSKKTMNLSVKPLSPPGVFSKPPLLVSPKSKKNDTSTDHISSVLRKEAALVDSNETLKKQRYELQAHIKFMDTRNKASVHLRKEHLRNKAHRAEERRRRHGHELRTALSSLSETETKLKMARNDISELNTNKKKNMKWIENMESRMKEVEACNLKLMEQTHAASGDLQRQTMQLNEAVQGQQQLQNEKGTLNIAHLLELQKVNQQHESDMTLLQVK